MIGLGEQLRQAHRDLDGEQLREFSRQQRLLIGALSRQSRQRAADAGHRLGDDAQRGIEETLHAVLADPEAARAWATGRLTKPLSASAGFPGVAEGGTAKPARPPAAAPKPAPRGKADEAHERRRQQLERARQDADEAEEALYGRQREAQSAAREAEEAAAEARRRSASPSCRTAEDDRARAEPGPQPRTPGQSQGTGCRQHCERSAAGSRLRLRP
ncbi:hypothetical protein [Streptomyces sp. NPDC054849]